MSRQTFTRFLRNPSKKISLCNVQNGGGVHRSFEQCSKKLQIWWRGASLMQGFRKSWKSFQNCDWISWSFQNCDWTFQNCDWELRLNIIKKLWLNCDWISWSKVVIKGWNIVSVWEILWLNILIKSCHKKLSSSVWSSVSKVTNPQISVMLWRLWLLSLLSQITF